VRNHVISGKNDHRPAYRRYGALRDGVDEKATSASFLVLFDIRLLQPYLPGAGFGLAGIAFQIQFRGLPTSTAARQMLYLGSDFFGPDRIS